MPARKCPISFHKHTQPLNVLKFRIYLKLIHLDFSVHTPYAVFQ